MSTNPSHIQREQRTIRHMIEIYCRRQRHQTTAGLCASCAAMLRYAEERIASCPVAGAKPACGLCRSNCFSTKMHYEFAQIMRYAGPRMLVRHPLLTMAHVFDAVRGGRGG